MELFAKIVLIHELFILKASSWMFDGVLNKSMIREAARILAVIGNGRIYARV